MLDVEKFIAGVHEYIGKALSPLSARIKALEDSAPVPGPKGDPGERGVDGAPGRDGVDGKDGSPGERGEKGEAGAPGNDGRDGINGKDGKDGAPGADGKSITVDEVRPLFDAAFAGWALDFERRAADVFQRAIDKIPAPKDGRDALEIEDLQVEHDGDGGVTLRFVRGEVRKEFQLQLPRFKDRGIYKEGEAYREGDGATWAGSFFIAQKDNPQGKPGESDGWRLAVKRGRDGKDADGVGRGGATGPVRLQ